ncbi:MAG: zinc ribbon domain-containing protein [Betaproteobacteria bacterium]|nr:zinc ribbon domain-containing protein [Betaproteobacteria bacterium]
MPIYEYRCSDCGFQKEFLQKVSEPRLTTCTSCGKETFEKMLTAAGFQLKGSGWYATDFKHSGSKPAEKSDDAGKNAKAATGDAAKADSAKSDGGGDSGAKTADTPAASSTSTKSDSGSGGSSETKAGTKTGSSSGSSTGAGSATPA